MAVATYKEMIKGLHTFHYNDEVSTPPVHKPDPNVKPVCASPQEMLAALHEPGSCDSYGLELSVLWE